MYRNINLAHKIYCTQLYRPSWRIGITQIIPRGRYKYCWMYQSFFAHFTIVKHSQPFVRLSSLSQVTLSLLWIFCTTCHPVVSRWETWRCVSSTLWWPWSSLSCVLLTDWSCWTKTVCMSRILLWAQMEGVNVRWRRSLWVVVTLHCRVSSFRTEQIP